MDTFSGEKKLLEEKNQHVLFVCVVLNIFDHIAVAAVLVIRTSHGSVIIVFTLL